MKRRSPVDSLVLLLAITVLTPGSGRSQSLTNVLTWHNDNQRTGANTQETVLTPAKINKVQFGRLCTAPTDGQIYAQPLVVTGVPITLNGVTQQYNVVYVVTQNDGVYAFDADHVDGNGNCSQLLYANLAAPYGEVPVPCENIGAGTCQTIAPVIGILGTPVIAATTSAGGTTGTLFVVAESVAGSGSSATYNHRIHALDITTLQDVVPAVVMSGSSGKTTFISQSHIQRPGLLLLPGAGPGGHSVVYAAFSHMDGAAGLPTGWVFSYDATNLSQLQAFATASAGKGAGIWQGGAGLAAGNASATDPTQYIYIVTADGTFDANTGGGDYGDTFLKLPPNLIPTSPPSASTYFTPFNQNCMLTQDIDFGSGGVLLLPNGLIPSNPYLAVTGSKDGNLYLIDRGTPGGYNGVNNTNIQTIPNAGTSTTCSGSFGYHNTPAYWNGNLYLSPFLQGSSPQPAVLMRYPVGSSCTPGPVCTPAAAASTIAFSYGTTPSVSSNGSTNAIVWAMWSPRQASGGKPAVLYAFQAGTLRALYGSSQCVNDAAGPGVKFSVPTVANGKVYIGTQTELDIYGLISGKTCQ